MASLLPVANRPRAGRQSRRTAQAVLAFYRDYYLRPTTSAGVDGQRLRRAAGGTAATRTSSPRCGGSIITAS